jgi:hypothetical protein
MHPSSFPLDGSDLAALITSAAALIAALAAWRRSGRKGK